MRALMDHDWRKSKGEIYKQTVECMKAHPDAGCFTVFDYVSGPFTAKVYSLAEESNVLETLRKAGAEWELTVARAARSQGRITVHVMRAYEGKSGRYWVLPLRSTTGEVHEQLKRIAADAVAGVNVPDFSTLDMAAWDVDAMH